MPSRSPATTDRDLQSDIEQRLQEHPMLAGAGLQVEVHARVVTLTGTVDSYEQRYAAESATRQVTGLRGIAMRVHVRAADSRS